MDRDRRRLLALGAAALGSLAGCAGSPSGDSPTATATPTGATTPTATATATSTATPGGTGSAPTADGAITIEGTEWALSPAAFATKRGEAVEVTFENVGSVTHNLSIGEFPVAERPAKQQAEEGTFMAKTATIQPEKTATVTVTPDAAGTYPYWCDVSGHRQAGMEGRMMVE